ncbi:MAG: AI-2E family transporter [Paracoccus sp. (in: a-proteobacteria)]|uniref:AI-2E family transporter n=1 Tax=Paracoccus sp. TaxID=267 RepID=UPI0026DF0D8A|nr:AI-2E family transporter [Paracoccus sp. (in: a-proteobacteria)]MDO5614233.1 AI-2E family transporter [Paracoccus sp. (in: a-proteobacteria)]
MEETRESILRQRLQTGFLGIIAFALLLFLMVQARFMLISLAIAIILFSLTSDAINAIARQGVARWLATILALVAIAALLLGISTSIIAQVNAVVQTAVSYTERAQAALPDLTEWLGPNMQESLVAALRNVNIAGWMRSVAGQAGDLLSGSILIILFVGFMFAERMFFPAKIERLAGDPEQARRIGRIISTIMHKVNRYLVVKTAVSAVTGFCVWGVFKLAGLDLAMPIAVLTFVFNFIPSVGSIVATVVAFLLAFVLSGDLALALVIGAACTALQFVIGNVLDPMLLGQTLRLSSFGIIISLAFWGSVWGIPGMFLAVPIMVSLMIVCAHTVWLRPVAIMLSREGLPELAMDEDVGTDPLTTDHAA